MDLQEGMLPRVRLKDALDVLGGWGTGPRVEPVSFMQTRREVSVGKDSPVSSASPESVLEVSGWGSGPFEEQAINRSN